MNETKREVTYAQMVVVTAMLAMLFAAAMAYVTTKNLFASSEAIQQMNIMKQENETLKLIVSTMPGGVAFIDIDSLAFTYVNEGFRQITQRRSSHLLGNSMSVVVTDKHHPKLAEALANPIEFWSKLRQTPYVNPTAEIQRPDGTVLKVRTTFRAVKQINRREFLMFIDPRIVDEEPADGN